MHKLLTDVGQSQLQGQTRLDRLDRTGLRSADRGSDTLFVTKQTSFKTVSKCGCSIFAETIALKECKKGILGNNFHASEVQKMDINSSFFSMCEKFSRRKSRQSADFALDKAAQQDHVCTSRTRSCSLSQLFLLTIYPCFLLDFTAHPPHLRSGCTHKHTHGSVFHQHTSEHFLKGSALSRLLYTHTHPHTHTNREWPKVNPPFSLKAAEVKGQSAGNQRNSPPLLFGGPQCFSKDSVCKTDFLSYLKKNIQGVLT